MTQQTSTHEVTIATTALHDPRTGELIADIDAWWRANPGIKADHRCRTCGRPVEQDHDAPFDFWAVMVPMRHVEVR